MGDTDTSATADLLAMSAAAMARAIRSGEITSEELVRTHLDRIERVNPSINAVVALREEAARFEAETADRAVADGADLGPLHGVPMTVKDCFGVAGIPATVGTKGLANNVPAQDDVTVARLKDSGAIVLGKTNCPELMLAFETDNLVYGRTNNPYDVERTPGGSSGGEAAAVAAELSPFGLASDSLGSTRIPAHFCGTAGLKTTHGRIPLTSGVFPSTGPIGRLRSIGILSRRVEDLGIGLRVLSGPDGRDPWAAPVPVGDPGEVDVSGLRVAVHDDNGIAPPTLETSAAVRDAAEALAGAGAAVEEARPPGVEQMMTVLQLFGGDGGAELRRMLEAFGTSEEDLSPLVRNLLSFSAGSVKSGSEVLALQRWWDEFRGSMLEFMQSYDVIVCPVAAVPAVPHGTGFENLLAFSYSWTFNVTGWPVAVVRAGSSPEGLPIGVQLAAGPWRDHVALAAAVVVEDTLGGWQPPQVAP
jgi:amidase